MKREQSADRGRSGGRGRVGAGDESESKAGRAGRAGRAEAGTGTGTGTSEVEWSQPAGRSAKRRKHRLLLNALRKRPREWAVWGRGLRRGASGLLGYYGPQGFRFSQMLRRDGLFDVWVVYDPERDLVLPRGRRLRGFEDRPF